MTDLQDLLERSLEKKQLERKDRKRSGLWSPSQFGRCYRLQFMNRKGEGSSNPPNSKSLKIFRVGNIIHEDIQSQLFDKNQCEVEITVDDIHGFADVVTDEEVIDIKTAGEWQWKKINGKAYNIGVDNESYVLQLMAYVMLLNRKRGILAFIRKDTYEIKQFIFELGDWKFKVMEELDILRAYWASDTLPPARPRAFGGKECNYCVFKDTCQKIGGDVWEK